MAERSEVDGGLIQAPEVPVIPNRYEWVMAKRNKRLLGFAREMRKDPTRSELHLWAELRGEQLGVRFRRQEPIGPFVVDFVCLKRSLVVEVDGGSHDSTERDRRRDRWLTGQGFFVLHVTDVEVLDRIDETVGLIRTALVAAETIEDPANLTWS